VNVYIIHVCMYVCICVYVCMCVLMYVICMYVCVCIKLTNHANKHTEVRNSLINADAP